ncbi:rCG36910 [Rattus norvegicus]|uniref:RCG36910 n=1 Tax=Rattus norvegicus TaxID=10116 RepID=A6HU19_RAT|nr:rCG36910 [Rattus norvegicus]
MDIPAVTTLSNLSVSTQLIILENFVRQITVSELPALTTTGLCARIISVVILASVCLYTKEGIVI